ncbi:MAG TPA: dUTP diphosphatase [Solirubrobacteraceae bacterium]|nr:dUTP diphosphatase [Solirubrobacteraceae bacterium]
MDAARELSALPVQRLDPRAILPSRAHPGDAGLDLHAIEGAELGPGERASIGTGIAVQIPEGWAGLVLPRSGLAARHGISVVNAPGLIDAGYRGEVRVLLLNTDPKRSWKLQAGDRIAQLVISPVALLDPEEVLELSSTSRGLGGFGSSGS